MEAERALGEGLGIALLADAMFQFPHPKGCEKQGLGAGEGAGSWKIAGNRSMSRRAVAITIARTCFRLPAVRFGSVNTFSHGRADG